MFRDLIKASDEIEKEIPASLLEEGYTTRDKSISLDLPIYVKGKEAHVVSFDIRHKKMHKIRKLEREEYDIITLNLCPAV